MKAQLFQGIGWEANDEGKYSLATREEDSSENENTIGSRQEVNRNHGTALKAMQVACWEGRTSKDGRTGHWRSAYHRQMFLGQEFSQLCRLTYDVMNVRSAASPDIYIFMKLDVVGTTLSGVSCVERKLSRSDSWEQLQVE